MFVEIGGGMKRCKMRALVATKTNAVAKNAMYIDCEHGELMLDVWEI